MVAAFFCYGDEENARIYAVHLTTANQRQDAQSASCLCGYWGGMGRKEVEQGKLPNRKLRESKQVGEKVVEQEKTLQPEATEK